ncbi:DUF2786 domain-containing protein [soil metagenome]
MGKNNRQRRAAKQRQRHRDTRATQGRRPREQAAAFDPEFAAFALQQAIRGAAADHAAVVGGAASQCMQVLAGPGSPYGPNAVAQVVESLLSSLLDVLAGAGWQPLDLRQLTIRRLSAGHLPVLGVLLTRRAASHPPSQVHPRWTGQLREFGLDEALGDASGLLALGRRYGLDDVVTLTLGVELLGLLSAAPKLVLVLPPPGQFDGTADVISDAQERVLARVRALLAKAESTEYAEEAEALTAKAQDLMSRHSLERLMARHRRREADPVTAGRIWLDAPYATAKSLLVQEVAQANRARAVWSEHLGCVTLLGREPDLVAVELLTTSLLVQATRAMVADQTQTGRRTRSFRQSFLVAFAGRIGERLCGASDGAAEDISGADRAELLPVLRAASAQVDEAVEATFPRLVHRRVGVSNGLGWAAGRAAADLALLDVRGQVEGAPDAGLAETA